LKNSSFSLSGLSLTAQWNKAKRDGSGAGGLGGFIYAENSTISLKADSGDMVLKNNFADNVKNDVYMDFAELNLINVNGNQIRFEGGVYAVNKSALKKEGDGLLYFSGRNYFDAVRYFDLAPGSEMLSENAQWTYINNENPLNLNSSSVSFIGGVSEFINNSAQNFGAGIYASNSKVLFRKGSVSFIKNTSQSGAVVYADNASDILFENIDVLNISENHSIAGNSVFSAQNASQINFADVSSASVINNKAQNGAFLYLDNSNFVLTGGKWFNASGNIAEDSSSIGGAIAVIQGEFAVNAASIVFTSNTAQTGGAIYAQNSEIKLNSNNGYILFEENSAQAGTDIYLDNSKFYLTASGAKSAAKLDGGIEAYNGSVLEFKGNITLNRKNILENSSLAIEDGKVNIGGEFSFSRGLTEMQIRKSTVSIKGSSSESVKFISNNGGGIGGAVSVYDSSLEIIDGKISGNRGSAAGAIYLENSILRIAAQEGDFVFSSNTFNGIKNDISFNSAELIFYAQGASSKQTSMAQWYERRYDGMNGQKSAARVYATPIPARDDYKQIILNGGMFGSGAVTKEGGGELILRGRNEISDALTINAGIVSLDTASFKAASIDIKRGSVYNTYRGETGIGGNVTTLSGRLTVEASTVSLGLYFNEERTNPVSADSIFASSIMNRNGSLKITAYGEISEYADALNDVMLMKWNDIHSAVNFGYGGAAMWFDGDLWKGYVGYQLEVRNASELWLVILSTGLGLVGTGGNFTYNEREAAGMLNRVDFNTLAAIKMRIPVSEIKDEVLLRKTLGQISGEFLANVLKMGALYDESAKIFPRLYREAGEAERPSIWAQADMSSIFRKDEGSVREYSSSLIGFQAGINLKRRSDELFGIYGSQESGELKQDLDRADMKDISGGIYWGSFNNWASMKWTAGFGQQSYDVKREVNIGTQSYSPQSSFDTYSIRGSGEVEFEFFNNDSSFVINPVIGAQAAYIINSEIDESEGDLAELLVKSAAYPRLTFTGGLRFRGEGDFTRWNFSLYAGYAVLGGQDFSYQMILKSAESDGKMEIKPNYEGDMFAGLSFGIEASLSNNLSLYASADAKISPSAENKLLGYVANAGLKLRFGTAKARPKPEPKPEPQKPAPEIKPDPIADTIPQIAPEIVTQDFSSLDDLDEASLISMLNNLEGEVGKRVSDEDKKLLVEAQERRKNLIKSFRLSAAVFRSGSAELTAESKNDIRKLAQSLKEYEYNKITVEGHTDSTGQAENNRVLSFERARSVYLELVKNGIPREKLDYVGFGAMMPVSSNKTEVGKRQNRRVEVFVEGDSKDAQAQRLTLERDNYLNYENSLNRQGGDDMEISASQRERSAIDNAEKQAATNSSVKKTQSVKAQSVKTASKKTVAVKPAAKVKKTSSVKKTASAKTATTKRAAAKSGVSAKNTAKKKIKK
ncbi:MAG: autotransporter domain-containing protein, partial [Elusimicrobiota bacterium]|jgi:predicted outer membrane repeat protein|nr:autotransporter domain-containing protein [Elusimicrobiota bacterium]